MDTLSKLLPEDLYHSYIVEGNPDELPQVLRGFFEVRGDIKVNSPDVLYQIYTHFFFVIPNSSVLSGTVLSRVHVIKVNGNENIIDSKKFLSLKPADRIEMIAEIIKEHKDNDGSGMLRFKAIELINGLEKILHEKFKLNKNDKNLHFILKELATMREYLQTPGASVKMILEHIALVL